MPASLGFEYWQSPYWMTAAGLVRFRVFFCRSVHGRHFDAELERFSAWVTSTENGPRLLAKYSSSFAIGIGHQKAFPCFGIRPSLSALNE